MQTDLTLHPANIDEKIGLEQVRQAAINETYTVYGREVLLKQKPLCDPSELEILLKMANEWIEIIQSDSTIPLTVIEDVRTVVKESRAENSLLPLDFFPIVLENARLARIILSFFKKDDHPYEQIYKKVRNLVSLQPLEEEIKKVITEHGTLRDDASAELKTIRTKLNRKRSELRKTIDRLMKTAREKGMSSDEGPTIRGGRMVIPIQAEFRRKVEGFIHDVSASGQTVYVEPAAALQVNNDIRQLEAEEKREIERIIKELTSVVRNYATPLFENTKIIGLVDALHSRVKTGLRLGGAIPEYSTGGTFELIDAKNPNLLLKKESQKSSEPVVPLHLKLDRKEKGLIITGPNAGGKSVAMKTTGILCLMLQYGYPIPVAPHSKFPVLSGLFIDVGDDQSIESDLSTFSSRLHWMKETLRLNKPGALVLIDEAGTGTDPEEGGALFQAFIESLIENDVRVIATTHHGSLKVFAHEHPNVVNGAMEFDQKSLSPTYRFRKGVPGSSYAFEIADRMEVPKPVMDRARELLGEQRDKMGNLLLNLEKQIQQAEAKEKELAAKERKTAELEKTLSNKNEDFEKKRKKKLEEAYAEADRIMKTANQRIEQAVEKIMSAGKQDKDLIKEARKEIEETKDTIRQRKAKMDIKMQKGSTQKPPEVGDFVTIGQSGTAGEVVDISGKQVTILVNGMKIKSKLKDIEPASKPESAKKSKTRAYRGSEKIDLSVKPKLDIRGYRGDDAIKELQDYLDRASARGLKRVEIVHGKGEGILKKLVHEYLENRKEITGFELAPIEHGGAGCTIVELG